MSENLSNSQKILDEDGKKIFSYNWTIAESGSGAVDYIIMYKLYDFLILEIMCWFHRRMRPFWIKRMEYFR